MTQPQVAAAARTCAIHQPNFFPWMGYFDKISKADVFIFLDDVDYPRSGSGMGSWVNRVKVEVQGEARWVGCPVERFSGRRSIKDVKIAEDGKWRARMLKTLHMNYAKAPSFERTMAVLKPLVMHAESRLADFNIRVIRSLCALLGIESDFKRQSELAVQGSGTNLLIRLTREVGAGAYLCGGGAAGYQEDELFARESILLLYQEFAPLPYGRRGTFLPGLSIIDFLMWSEEWFFPE